MLVGHGLSLVTSPSSRTLDIWERTSTFFLIINLYYSRKNVEGNGPNPHFHVPVCFFVNHFLSLQIPFVSLIAVSRMDCKKPPKTFLLHLARALETGKGKGRQASLGAEPGPHFAYRGVPSTQSSDCHRVGRLCHYLVKSAE